MSTKETVEQLNKAIKEWSKGNDKLVVAIDGYTGVGKTTLLKNLKNLNKDILPINRDGGYPFLCKPCLLEFNG